MDIKILKLLAISIISIYADNNLFTIENDAFVSMKDGRYTNGLFYTWMSSKKDNTNYSYSLTHLMFTPNNLKHNKPILNDLPYAGYAKLNFLLYKSTLNSFHEFGINIGAVGNITKAEEIQSTVHKIIGVKSAKGWNTQLKNQLTSGISYLYAYKIDPIDIYCLKFDWSSDIRFDIGNFYTGGLIGSSIRIGSNFPNTFPTTGNFIGGNESSLLNFSPIHDFNWDISFGLFANKVKNYYIIDKARDIGYTISKIDYMLGEQLSFDIFYHNIQYTFKTKSIYVHNRPLSSASKEWGGITIVWKF